MTTMHPARVPVTRRALVGLSLYRGIAAFAIGYPVARAVGALGASSLPDGDLSLFQPAGMYLLETLRLGARALPASLESASVVALVLAISGLAPLSVALVDMVAPGSTRSERWAVAAARTPTLFFLSGATLLVQAGLAVATRVLMVAGASFTDSLPDERVADLVALGVAALGLIAVFVVGVVQDVARARVIRLGEGGVDAIRDACGTVFRGGPLLVSRFVGPAIGAAAVVVPAAWLTGIVDVSRPGSVRIAGVFALHQIAMVAIVWLRLRALGVALGLASTETRRDADESGASDGATEALSP